MNDILDYQEQRTVEPIYLRRSILLLKICGVIIALIFAFTVALYRIAESPRYRDRDTILGSLVLFLFTMLFIVSSTGLFCSLKSYLRKEGPPRRLIYMFAHGIISLFLFSFVVLIAAG